MTITGAPLATTGAIEVAAVVEGRADVTGWLEGVGCELDEAGRGEGRELDADGDADGWVDADDAGAEWLDEAGGGVSGVAETARGEFVQAAVSARTAQARRAPVARRARRRRRLVTMPVSLLPDA
jgi:hypothetical protein